MVIKGCNSRKGDITRPGYCGGDAGAIWPRGAEPSGFHEGGAGGRKWSKQEEGHVLTRRASSRGPLEVTKSECQSADDFGFTL